MGPEVKIAQTLDCKGLLCPLPIIKLSKAIKTIEVGQVLEMLATDPGSVPDVEAFQSQTGHEIVAKSSDGGVFRFLVKRTK
jgi:tRNA 2-thiouridine synthesizing protein A